MEWMCRPVRKIVKRNVWFMGQVPMIIVMALVYLVVWPHHVMAESENGMKTEEVLRLGEEFGMIVGAVDESLQKVLGLQRAEGVVVFEVIGGKPADLAGIRVGSIIKEIDKVEIRTLEDFGRALKSALHTENFTIATYEPADPEGQGVSGGINFHFVRTEKT
jgi:membrane-associated protease RseP (regulator of RpoE activity)